jgi:hypothetical protein
MVAGLDHTKEYVDHVRARHGPLRAPLDTLLLLVGTPERTIRKARASWQYWALGESSSTTMPST